MWLTGCARCLAGLLPGWRWLACCWLALAGWVAGGCGLQVVEGWHWLASAGWLARWHCLAGWLAVAVAVRLGWLPNWLAGWVAVAARLQLAGTATAKFSLLSSYFVVFDRFGVLFSLRFTMF